MEKSIMSWKNFIIILCMSFAWSIFAGMTIVKNGKAEAEIVVPENALSSIKFAAKEIQQHIEKISGAKLPVVNTPSREVRNKIYIGGSKYTKKLGVDTSGLKMEGFRIVSKNDALVIVGKNMQRLPIPTGTFIRNRKTRQEAQKKWREFTGEKDWTLREITTARNYDPELKFSAQDATGTLYGAYEFLELLGVRWYMPGHDFGTVIPKKKTIVIPDLNISRSPEFPIRYFHSSWGNNKQMAWFKRQKLGWSYVYCCNHFLDVFMSPENVKKHPEYFAKVNGKYDTRGCTGRFGRPKLSSIELRVAATKYAKKMLDYAPELSMISMGMPDGCSFIGDEDAAAWDTEKTRGYHGKMSDYVWDFNKYIADRLEKSHPDKYLSYLAYHAYLRAPEKVDKLNKNIALIKLEKLGHDGPVKRKRKEMLDLREEWLEKLTSGKFYIWDHWLFHTAQRYPRVPAIFTNLLQEDMLKLRGKCEGKFIELGLTKAGKDNSVGLPALNHLMYYIQAKLYWNPDLDMKALLEEYYKLYYGPANTEMKEFFEFSEEVWMRPGSRSMSSAKGFLKPEDVDRYFDILKRAKAKTEKGSNYYKRIDLLENEMVTLKTLFDDLKRSGPTIRGNWVTGKIPEIDGDLTKSFWLDKKLNKWYPMKNNKTGRHVKNPALTTSVAFRKARHHLIIGIKCNEDKMESLKASCTSPDNSSIFNDDVVEVYIETPQRSYFKIVVNPNGALFDECTDTEIAARETKTVMWTPGIKTGVKKGKDFWSVELVIPLEDFGDMPPSRSQPWGVNVFRTRFAGGKVENFAISPTGGKYADLSKMANFAIGK